MKLLLAGGGTAGHINPALAIAGYVCQREPATQILYVGAKGGMEERLVPQAGYDFEKIEISGFQRKLSFESLKKNVHTVKLVFSSSRTRNGLNGKTLGCCSQQPIHFRKILSLLRSQLTAVVGTDKSTTKTKTTQYFSDINGDGLVDLVSNGKVFFNHLEFDGTEYAGKGTCHKGCCKVRA